MTTVGESSTTGPDGFIPGLDTVESLAVAIGGGVVIVSIIIAFSLCCCYCRCCCSCRRRTKKTDKKQIGLPTFQLDSARRRSVDNNYLHHNTRNVAGLDTLVRTHDAEAPGTEDSLMMENVSRILENSVMKRTLIDCTRLKMGKLIGEGKYGHVFEGKLSKGKKLSSMPVAVKTINVTQCSENEIQQFLDETLCMRGLHHRNVLSVIGLCIRDGRPFVVLPLMQNGDLKSYVAKKIREFTVKDLLGYSAQVAEGMTYLQEQGFVHRDLAARNCVVSGDQVVKVADFGLSRDIFVDEYYRIANLDLPLPVRWMAVESITTQVFTHKSDVWSFGVLMWEVLTRGRVPYSGMDNVHVIINVRNGQKLEQPSHVNDEIFSILQSCWLENPKERPEFEELARMLNKIIQTHSVL